VYGSGKWRAKQGQIRGCPSSSTLPPPTMTWLFIGEHVHRRWGKIKKGKKKLRSKHEM